MKDCLDLNNPTAVVGREGDFQPHSEDSLNTKLSEWYGEERLLVGNKSDAKEVISAFKPFFEEKKIKIIVIGGTNGKGETAHRLDALLRREGLKTALWTSPHVLSLRERFLFHGEQVSYKFLNQQLDNARESCLNSGWSLSYYEFLFFVFCELSLSIERSKGLDVVLLEVGLGGRLDAVNFLGPDLTAICSLSRDHQGILGHRLKDILIEKLGISRPQVPLITGFELEWLQLQTQNFCSEKEVPHHDLFNMGYLKKSDDYVFRNKVMAYFLKEVFCLGEKKAVFEKLSPDAVRKEVCKDLFSGFTGGKGRFEQWSLGQDNDVLFVGAHNIDGIRKLTEALTGAFFDHVLLSFSKRNKKDILDSLSHLATYPCLYKSISLTFFDHEKAWNKEAQVSGEGEDQILKLCDSLDIKVLSNWQESLNGIFQKKAFGKKTEGKRTLVTGSYYFIGEVQKFLLSKV
ncbi:MAG: hypothetical protein CME68_06495 [Halobacteriovoraceae bacterium]|nr:hypothetical protein [Halobacteriovoraceae bacterium]